MSEKNRDADGSATSIVAPGIDDFAPANPTDGRALYEYASKWPDHARKQQRNEGLYLALLWALGLFGIAGLLVFSHVDSKQDIVVRLGIVFCTGLIGGTTFDVKWWYHSIAKGLWHLDRRAWRISVPWVAAIVAVFVHELFRSDMVGFLNPSALDKIHNVLAFSFLVGYFSDSAIAKLAEIAESLFGAGRGRRGGGNSR